MKNDEVRMAVVRAAALMFSGIKAGKSESEILEAIEKEVGQEMMNTLISDSQMAEALAFFENEAEEAGLDI